MSDYFSEYSSYVGAKGLPSPAETPYTTPYETPGFLRSKRNSRATTIGSGRSREASSSPPPPLPADATDYADRPREGRYGSLDPRRFTPTLHANLVSEILSLRRELDSKNNLVENLETSLANAKTDNEALAEELTTSAKEVRNAKQQVAQMESGTYEALETMVKERDTANEALQELKTKLEMTQKKTKGQDEDAERTQTIWEREKEQWENERRQLEMRVHVTETRLRSFVDEMAAQQASLEEVPIQADDFEDPDAFKDSAVGNDIDTISIASHHGKKHTRNVSSLSSRTGFRGSVFLRAADTPEPFAKPGHSLADELGIDEEDEETEGELDDTESVEEELEYHERRKTRLDSRHGSVVGDMDSKAKRVLGLSGDMSVSPTMREFPGGIRDDEVTSRSEIDCVSPSTPNFPKHLLEPVVPSARNSAALNIAKPARKVQYVDTGYQPSPPSSPTQNKHKPEPLQVSLPSRATPAIHIDSGKDHGPLPMRHPVSLAANTAVSPISPPETPIVDGATWTESKKAIIASPKYSSTSTQTENIAPLLEKVDRPKHASLEVPIPQITIHPATSRPSSPRPYALPPNTKNAGAQVNLPWPGQDASVQTEEIRIDQRPVKLPAHLLPSHLDNLAEPSAAAKAKAAPLVMQHKAAKRSHSHKPKISTDLPMLSSFPSPPMRSPPEVPTSTHTRDGSSNNFGKMPLKAIPLPKPTLAPAFSMDEVASETSKGPLNRSSQFGVSNQNRTSRQLAEIDHASDDSESSDSEAEDQAGSMPVINASGRFEGPDLSQFNFDNFTTSPQRRPTTANSYDAAPAPSVSSSRHNSVRAPSSKRPPPARSSAQLKTHSRSPSFGSVASSSNFSTQSALPPHAIPKRSSSRFPAHTHVESAHSPTPGGSAARGSRVARGGHQRQGSLRKVQSAVSIRGRTGKLSPQKPRRRRRSPKLTPVQSMAFESPKPTKFPIPELPTPLQQSLAFDWGVSPPSPTKRPDTATTAPPTEESQLIDSIAGTMVGEWMWKYMRKRKSFGVDAAEAFTARNSNGNSEENGSSLTSHGTRHKRWVWLSPYERTIMWDSKQPSSGNALLGKKGRKLVIQSVLDVADEMPLPKRPELPTAFHRSILILTPSRALKFTAVNAERHALWMNALSFLAESDRVQLPELPLMPPVPDESQKSQTRRQRSPSFGRSHLRDSVNLAKGRQPSLLRSISAQNSSSADVPDIPSSRPEEEGADFPCIPRLYSNTNRHQRKRSNTGSPSPRLAPALAGLRSFSSTAIPSTSSSSGRTHGATPGRGNAPTVATSSSQSDSRRPSVNGLNSPDQFNFFDAMGTGTVRMQAFVDPAIKNGVLYVPHPPMPGGPLPGSQPQQSPHRRHRNNSSVSNATIDKRRAGYVFDEDGSDPFRGF